MVSAVIMPRVLRAAIRSHLGGWGRDQPSCYEHENPSWSFGPGLSLPSQTVMVSHSLFISAWAPCPCSYSTADSDFHIVHCLLMTYYKVELVLFMSSHEDMRFHPLGDDSFIGLDS